MAMDQKAHTTATSMSYTISSMDVMKLNTWAVAALHDASDYCKAAGMLTEALSRVHQMAQDGDLQEEENAQFDYALLGPLTQEILRVFPVGIQHKPQGLSSEQQASLLAETEGSNVFRVYNRAFLFAPPKGQQDLDITNEKVNNHMKIVLLYNLALCHQLQGMSDVHGQFGHIDQSRDLYLMAAALLNNDYDDPSSILLNLALYDNLSHAYTHLMEFDEVERCVDQLRMSIKDAETISRYVPSPYESEYAHFRNNATVAESLRSNACPAA